MKALILSVVLFLQSNVLIPAETVASNSTATGFTISFTHLSNSHVYTYYMEPGFYNHSNKWQLEPGFYTITFTPASSTYGPTAFLANGENVSKYGASNSGVVTLNNVQLYEGGGNQVIITGI